MPFKSRPTFLPLPSAILVLLCPLFFPFCISLPLVFYFCHIYFSSILPLSISFSVPMFSLFSPHFFSLNSLLSAPHWLSSIYLKSSLYVLSFWSLSFTWSCHFYLMKKKQLSGQTIMPHPCSTCMFLVDSLYPDVNMELLGDIFVKTIYASAEKTCATVQAL